MHNGIPWWLVVVLEAIHNWPVTLGLIVALVGAVWRWKYRRNNRSKEGA